MKSNHPLHERAVNLAKQFKRVEADLVEVLEKIGSTQLFRAMGYSSLFDYATKSLGLTESVAYGFISVCRKTKEVPQLMAAIQSGSVTVSQVRRVASVITRQNAADLIQKVQTLTQREIEKEVAKINPREETPDRSKYITENRIEVRFGASESFMRKLKRVQNLVSQKTRASASFEVALENALDIYLEKNDPIKRAERVLKKERELPEKIRENSENTNDEASGNREKTSDSKKSNDKKDSGIENESSNSKDSGITNKTQGIQKLSSRRVPPRTAISAHLKHQVFERDKGSCTFVEPNGAKCGQSRWIDIHHKHPRELGGTDAIENLTILCSNHHRAIHEEIGNHSGLRDSTT